MKKYIKPAFRAEIVITENVIASSPSLHNEQGDDSWFAPDRNNDLDRGDISDNGLWSKDRW